MSKEFNSDLDYKAGYARTMKIGKVDANVGYRLFGTKEYRSFVQGQNDALKELNANKLTNEVKGTGT
jgi:hypothetical protein